MKLTKDNMNKCVFEQECLNKAFTETGPSSVHSIIVNIKAIVSGVCNQRKCFEPITPKQNG